MSNSAERPEPPLLADPLALATAGSSSIPPPVEPIVSAVPSASVDKSLDDSPAGQHSTAASDGANNVPGPADAPAEAASEQVVLILVGLVGAGKSTFADALEKAFPIFKRCCQDEMGDRRAVEGAARRALQTGQSVCIDRTNFDRAQRAHWLNIASEAGVPARVVFFNTPYSVCEERLQLRRGHPTLTDVQAALSVLRRFSSSFQPPHPSEGYDSLLRLTPEDHPSMDYTRDELLEILRRVQTAPAESGHEQEPQHGYNRGRGGAGYTRGRGAYDGRGGDHYRGYRGGYSGRGQQHGSGWSPARGGRGTYGSSGLTSGGWRSRGSSVHEYQRGFDRGGVPSTPDPSRGSFAGHTTSGRGELNGYRGFAGQDRGASHSPRSGWGARRGGG